MFFKNKGLYNLANIPFKDVGLDNIPYYFMVRPHHQEVISPLILKEHFKSLPHSEFCLDYTLIHEGKSLYHFITFQEQQDSVEISLYQYKGVRMAVFKISVPFNGIMKVGPDEIESSIYAQQFESTPDGTKLAVLKSDDQISHNDKTMALATATQALTHFLDVLNDFDFVVCKKTKNFKRPDKFNAKLEVIYISSRKYIEYDKKSEYIPQHIEWTHSWIVRGHWRLLRNNETVGKDRDGNRCEYGRTWVCESIKNKHLPLTNPLRMVVG